MDPSTILAEVFGRLSWERHPCRPGTKEDYRAKLLYHDVPMSIRREYRHETTASGKRTRKLRWDCVLQAHYAPRPLVLSMGTHEIGWPHLPTGDPDFEAHFRLAGAPPDILRRAFDADLRAQLLAHPWRPWIFGEGGVFELDVRTIVEEGKGGPRELRATADVFAAVAGRICGEFDREHALVASQQGPEAAAAWLRDQARAVTNAGRRKQIILVLVGFFLVTVFIVISVLW